MIQELPLKRKPGIGYNGDVVMKPLDTIQKTRPLPSRSNPASISSGNTRRSGAKHTPELKKATHIARRAHFGQLAWSHTPQSGSPLMRLPIEILDQIVCEDVGLALQDHLSFSGTCKQIRAAYTIEVWLALSGQGAHHWQKTPDSAKPNNRIFSNTLQKTIGISHQSAISQYGLGVTYTSGSVERGAYAYILNMVNLPRTSHTDAIEKWKLTEADLVALKRIEDPEIDEQTPRQYYTAAVRALAFKVYDGPLGHEAHLIKHSILCEGDDLNPTALDQPAD